MWDDVFQRINFKCTTAIFIGLIDWLKILFNLGSTLSKILFSVTEPLIHHLHTFILLYIQNIHILFTHKKKILLKIDIIVIKTESLLKDT